MDIKGKKIAFLGDSITFGVGASSPDKVYWQLIAAKTGSVCKGYGINGTRIAKQINPVPDAYHDMHHFITRVDLIDKDTDIIMVLGGVNDYAHGDAPLGKTSDRCEDTFYGACHLLYTKLIESFPKAVIVIITPLHFVEEDNECFNTARLEQKLKLLDFVNVIREVAAEYALPVLDLHRISGIQPKIAIQRGLFMPDGIHPNDAGYQRMADRIVAFLENL